MSDRTAAWWFAVGAIVVYVLAVALPIPAPIFHPRQGVWDFTATPNEPSMRWYGWLLAALVGGTAGMAIGRLVRRAPSWHVVWILATAALVVATIVHERRWFLR